MAAEPTMITILALSTASRLSHVTGFTAFTARDHQPRSPAPRLRLVAPYRYAGWAHWSFKWNRKLSLGMNLKARRPPAGPAPNLNSESTGGRLICQTAGVPMTQARRRLSNLNGRQPEGQRRPWQPRRYQDPGPGMRPATRTYVT